MSCTCPEMGREPLCPECLEHEAERRAGRLEGRIKKSGLPRKYHGLSFPDSEPARLARNWATHGGGLILCGEDFGVSKTYIAGVAAWHRLQNHHVSWVRVAQLMGGLRAGFEEQSRRHATEIVTGSTALVLDDLDKVNDSDFTRSNLHAIIDSRVEEELPLLITTNLTLEGIGELLGGQVKSRLAGYCRVIRMSGEDQRLARRAA